MLGVGCRTAQDPEGADRSRTLAPASTAGSPEAGSRPIYAHRGGRSRGVVENTRKSFRSAAASGSRLWETDVRFTSTDHPVLLHDDNLRQFGCANVKINAVSMPKARRCAAANGQTVTTLSEFVADLEDLDAQAMVGLKTVPTLAQWARLETALAPVRDRLVIQSFRTEALLAASRRGYRTAALARTALTPSQLPEGTDWYAPAWATLTDAQADAMHAAGVKVVVWTPDCSDWSRVPAAADALMSNDLPVNCH
jgi:glycerophosphoryl diester phosphodiesterase